MQQTWFGLSYRRRNPPGRVGGGSPCFEGEDREGDRGVESTSGDNRFLEALYGGFLGPGKSWFLKVTRPRWGEWEGERGREGYFVTPKLQSPVGGGPDGVTPWGGKDCHI